MYEHATFRVHNIVHLSLHTWIAFHLCEHSCVWSADCFSWKIDDNHHADTAKREKADLKINKTNIIILILNTSHWQKFITVHVHVCSNKNNNNSQLCVNFHFEPWSLYLKSTSLKKWKQFHIYNELNYITELWLSLPWRGCCEIFLHAYPCCASVKMFVYSLDKNIYK